jgi:hypothetical protein
MTTTILIKESMDKIKSLEVHPESTDIKELELQKVLGKS